MSNASYGYQWELLDLRTLGCNNGAANNDFWTTGDGHINYITEHEDIASCSQKEIAIAGIGFPSYNNIVKFNYGNTMNNHFLRAAASGRSFGVVTITTSGTDTVRVTVIGENGDVMLDTAQDGAVVMNNHASVTAGRNEHRLVTHRSEERR